MTSVNDQLRVALRADQPTVWIDVEGEVDLASASRLREALAEGLSHRPEILYVRMTGVTFIDSCGLATLSRAHRQAEHEGCRLVIHSPAKGVLRVLQLSGLDRQILIEHG